MKRSTMRPPLALYGALFCLAGALPAAADPTDSALDEVLGRMAGAQGAAYLEARGELAAIPGPVAERLDARLAACAWSAESWRADATVAIAQGWLARPELFQALWQLDGLQPERYLQRRVARPGVDGELRRLGPAAAPAFLELWLHAWTAYPFADALRYPEDTGPERIAELQAAERRALRGGLLVALGNTRHPAAPHLLEGVVRERAAEETLRASAAAALGATGVLDRAPLLGDLAQDGEEPGVLRQACLTGLARLTTPRSLEVLAAFARDAEQPLLRASAIANLGNLASAWRFASGSAEQRAAGEAMRAEASALLVGLLQGEDGAQLERRIAQALALQVWAPAAVDLRALSEDTAAPEALRARARRVLAQVELALSRG